MAALERWRGHGCAVFTILVWGVTFTCSKILLQSFSPIEILFMRFFLGFLFLCLLHPKFMPRPSFTQEKWFIAAGACGVTLYFLLENVALTLTSAANVAVILAATPFFTALVGWIFNHGTMPNRYFCAGFIAAAAGIALLSGGGVNLSLKPAGDVMALGAGLVWAFYTLCVNKACRSRGSLVQHTRRIFFYGLLFMLPCMLYLGFDPDLGLLLNWQNGGSLIFLGIGASALCYVTWNIALRSIGTVPASIYIYAIPVIGVIAAALILHERLNWIESLGAALTLAGLMISQIGSTDK